MRLSKDKIYSYRIKESKKTGKFEAMEVYEYTYPFDGEEKGNYIQVLSRTPKFITYHVLSSSKRTGSVRPIKAKVHEDKGVEYIDINKYVTCYSDGSSHNNIDFGWY